MAKETEGKQLILEEVKKAVDYIFYNPNAGFYLVSAFASQNKPVSSLLITNAYDIFRPSQIWWFQSVYVLNQYRGLGIFKSMFHEIEKLNKQQQYPLRLHVELENRRAQEVYKRLGMFDTNEIFIEDDFYFDNSIQFEDNQQFKFQLANKQETDQFKDHLRNGNGLVSLMNKEVNQIDQTLKLIDHIQSISNYQHLFIVLDNSTNKIIGYFPVFYEYSDWRNGNIIHINDLRIVKDIYNTLNYKQLVSSLMNFFKNIYNPPQKLTSIRWVIEENSSFKDTLLQAGLQYGHYRIYEKNQF
ncbi:hypothetical protein ABPG72_015035 [Tetrahymena utriculariae]